MMIYYIMVLIASIAIDQMSKLYMIQLFTHELGVGGRGIRITLIPHVLNLRFAKNTGAAWSILKNNQVILMAFATFLIVVLIQLFIKAYKEKKPPLLLVSIMMVVGGAIGNLVDRLRLGYVVDFFECGFMDFPIFNVADVFICVGMGIIVVLITFFKVDWP